MTTAATKPMPVPTPTSQPYWDGLRAHELRMQRCRACRKIVFYPRSNCSFCLSSDLAWEKVSGDGTVYTFTIARRATAPQFEDEVPQKIAVVELDVGPRITTTLVNVAPEAVKIGMRVKPVFDDVSGADVTLLRYAPA
ncbi:MAG: Zn-ribbon domain-containing OB-fold protein [Chloroflexi bacterium]|nr:Zn-ribbon domain-containing OB-fold protein [Chloroflexota bacterium]